MSYERRLKAALDAGHPVTGAFSATDSIAADEINALNIDIEGGTAGMLNYLAKNRSRTNNGADLTPTTLLGRLHAVANGSVGADPFGTGVAGDQLTMEAIHAARNFLTIVTSPQLSTFDFVDTELDAAYLAMETVKVWKSPDTASLKGLSQNATSYALQEGLGIPSTTDITAARAL